MTERKTLWDDINAALVPFDASKPYRYEPKTTLPAVSPQMQAALDAEDKRVGRVLKRAKEMGADFIAACAEIERLKADLQVAMELLRAHSQPPNWMLTEPQLAEDWNINWGRLLAKHKEAT